MVVGRTAAGTGIAAQLAVTSDEAVVGFLVGVERAVAIAYDQAGSVLGSPAAVTTAAAFRAHHVAHAEALDALVAGAAPPRGPNREFLATLMASLQGITDQQAELAVLYSLEEQMAATYEWAVGRLAGPDALQQVAAILEVEGQHAVAIGILLSKTLDELVPPYQTDAGYLVPGDVGVTDLG